MNDSLYETWGANILCSKHLHKSMCAAEKVPEENKEVYQQGCDICSGRVPDEYGNY